MHPIPGISAITKGASQNMFHNTLKYFVVNIAISHYRKNTCFTICNITCPAVCTITIVWAIAVDAGAAILARGVITFVDIC